jgi:hypothetical protein
MFNEIAAICKQSMVEMLREPIAGSYIAPAAGEGYK